MDGGPNLTFKSRHWTRKKRKRKDFEPDWSKCIHRPSATWHVERGRQGKDRPHKMWQKRMPWSDREFIHFSRMVAKIVHYIHSSWLTKRGIVVMHSTADLRCIQCHVSPMALHAEYQNKPLVQCGYGGCNTGNGKKLSSNQAQLGQTICLAVA